MNFFQEKKKKKRSHMLIHNAVHVCESEMMIEIQIQEECVQRLRKQKNNLYTYIDLCIKHTYIHVHTVASFTHTHTHTHTHTCR